VVHYESPVMYRFSALIFLYFLFDRIIWFFQEVLFFEEGEPKIDGEPGDLKVCFVPVTIWLKFT